MIMVPISMHSMAMYMTASPCRRGRNKGGTVRQNCRATSGSPYSDIFEKKIARKSENRIHEREPIGKELEVESRAGFTTSKVPPHFS